MLFLEFRLKCVLCPKTEPPTHAHPDKLTSTPRAVIYVYALYLLPHAGYGEALKFCGLPLNANNIRTELRQPLLDLYGDGTDSIET